MKKFFSIVFILTIIALVLSACGSSSPAQSPEDTSSQNSIVLNGSSADFSGKGAAVNGNVITIKSEGEYHISGTLNDGQIIVDCAADEGKVFLYLDNADVTCLTAPAIYVLQAKSLHIVLSEGTTNRLVSGTEANLENYDENANGGAIFSEDDVDIEGSGSLDIFGYINNGITGKDDIKIKEGSVSIVAANNGIKGSESVSLLGGSVRIVCGNDGIKATSASKEGKGFVLIDGCTVSVECESDGISAETDLTISSGSVTVVSSGDPVDGSCKAIKAKTGIVINGGSVDVSSADHAIHSAAGIEINGGEINAVSTAGKAVAAHANIEITDGNLSVEAFKDAIETAGDISISGGNITVSSESDGIHSGTKAEGSSAATGVITISGGNVIIDAGGDPIDAKAEILVNGGTVLGTGTDKKLKVFSSGSAQAFFCVNFAGTADVELSVSGDGVNLTSPVSRKFSIIVCSAPGMVNGSTYTVSAGANSSEFTP